MQRMTTYLSLARRYCVLMPNNNRGGGVSRKITNLVDRKRLKTVVGGLAIQGYYGILCAPLAPNAPKLKSPVI